MPSVLTAPRYVSGWGVHLGIAVHLAGRSLEEARAPGFGQAQTVEGAEDVHQRRAHGVALVVRRARRAGEIPHLVQLSLHHALERIDDAVLEEREARIVAQVPDVGERAGRQVVETDHPVALSEEAIAKVRAEKAGPTENQAAKFGHCHPRGW